MSQPLPTEADLTRAREIVDGWREAQGWPGFTWSEGPRPDQWPTALEDMYSRFASALASSRLAGEQAECSRWMRWADGLTGNKHYLASKMRREITQVLKVAAKSKSADGGVVETGESQD